MKEPGSDKHDLAVDAEEQDDKGEQPGKSDKKKKDKKDKDGKAKGGPPPGKGKP